MIGIYAPLETMKIKNKTLSKFKEFFIKLEKEVRYLQSEKYEVIILGDFNMHFRENNDINYLKSDELKENIIINFLKKTNMLITNNNEGINKNICRYNEK